MRTLTKVLRTTLTAAALLAATGAAAQDGPSQTTAKYGDWLLRCTVTTAGSGAEGGDETKKCEIVQDVRVQNAVRPIMQLAVGQVSSPTGEGEETALSMVLQLPDRVYLPHGVKVALGEQTGDAAFVRCQKGGCIAVLPLTDETLTALSNAEAKATATATFYGRGAVTPPFSLKGFGGAKAAYDKEG